MNTATITPATEPTLADVQKELADLKAVMSKPIKTTTVDDAISASGAGFALGFVFFLFGLVGVIVMASQAP